MRIYAIKDRMLNYYQQPFAGPGDNQVLAAIAQGINNQENTSDVSQAPQHFEVWKLGHVTEDGHLVPEREFIADCASLVRGSVRNNTDPNERGPAPGHATGRAPGSPNGPGSPSGP